MKESDSEMNLDWKTLLAVKAELEIDLPNEVIHNALEIERKFQFDGDRADPVKMLERVVDEYIDEKS